MFIPIRCITCSKPIAHLWEEYDKKRNSGNSGNSVDTSKLFDQLGIERYCCKRMFLSHSNIFDDMMKYK